MQTDSLTYIVTLQSRRGEMMWYAIMHDDDTVLKEVPGPIPLNRRQAMALCEAHYKENNHG